MSETDILVLSPLWVLAGSAVVVMLAAAFLRRERVTAVLTLTALIAAIITLPLLTPYLPRQVTPLLLFDEFALFYVGLLLAALYHPVWTAGITGPGDFALATLGFLLLFMWQVPPWIVVILSATGGAALAALPSAGAA